MCKIICFIGIDGSGKSTLSRYLCKELKRRNYDVSYTWWLEGDNSLMRCLIRKIGKRNLENEKSGFKKNMSIYAKLFYILYPNYVLLDYIRFSLIKIWLPKMMKRDRILIFDRFIYDVILAISNEFDYSKTKKMKLFMIFKKLLPKIDLVLFIDVPPEISYMRKKDEFKSLEHAIAKWKDYQEISNIISKNVVKINNTEKINVVKNKILKETLTMVG